MDEDAKKAIAVFRFGVIADLIGRKLNRGEKERILKEKVSCPWDIPRSGRTYIGRSTILTWLRIYERSGRKLESLMPDERSDKGTSRALDEESTAALLALRKDLPRVTLALLMSEAKKRRIIPERVSFCDGGPALQAPRSYPGDAACRQEAVRIGTPERHVAVRCPPWAEGTS